MCSRARVREGEFRATSLSTLTQMVAGGAGVTLLPKLAVPTEAARGGLRVRAFAEPAGVQVMLGRHKRVNRSAQRHAIWTRW